MQCLHNFGPTSPNTFKIALYTSSATLNAATTAYTTSGEITGSGYVAGGAVLDIIRTPISSGTTAYIGFSDPIWAIATFTARGALIYNVTNGNRAVAVLDFGSDQSSVGGIFTVVFPAIGPTTSIVRIA